MRELLIVAAYVALTPPLLASPMQQASPTHGRMQLEHEDEVRSGPGYLVLADRRVFATMAFLNAVGYDREQPDTEMHPLRVQVREELYRRLASYPEELARWKAYYDELGYPVFVWVDYSFSMTPDVPFRQVHPAPETQYPEAAANLDGFPDVLNEFWAVADLDGLWAEAKPDYIAEIEQYDFDEMTRQMDVLWKYLRMPRQDDYLMVNVPNLLDAYYTGIGAQYGPYYYQVESPGASSYALNIHEYLHSIVNPLVERYFEAHREKLRTWYEAGKDGPYAQSYQSPVALTSESLVRALDYRLRVLLSDDPGAGAKAKERIDEITANGLVLTAPFYDLLEERYEPGSMHFADYVPVLFVEVPPAG